MPRNLVNAEDVSVAFGERTILDGVSLGVAVGDRIGVVGRNGGGKSTLLRVLAEAMTPDSGRVSRAGQATVEMVTQIPADSSATSVLDRVVGSRPEHDWAADPRIRSIFGGLLGGFPSPLADRPLTRLSGGERQRVELAAALVAQPDLLLLDEPTNHLDVIGIAWLADHLVSLRDRAYVVVTHDRWFLDAITERTWEVVGGHVEEYDGGYSAYVLAKAERARQAQAADARRAKLLRKELAWLRRGAPARTSKPRFRVEAANELISREPPPRDTVALTRFAGQRLGRTVYELERVSIRAGDRTLLTDVTDSFGPGDRIGILGANGAGKSTLLAALLGDRAVDAGRIRVGTTVHPALLSQRLDDLDPDLRVLEAVRDVAEHVDLGDGRDLSATTLCERLGFDAGRQWTPVRDLSGGERRRLQLTRILMASPNVVMLDEPTNDLDVETLASLEDLLDGFAGTLIVVSHDRYLLERTCETFRAITPDGDLRDLPGGVEEYLRMSAEGAAPTSQARESGNARTGAGRGGQRRTLDRQAASLERRIATQQGRIAELHRSLAAHPADHEAVLRDTEELRAVEATIGLLEAEWFDVLEQIEGLD